MAMKDENGKFNSAVLDYVRQGSVELMQSLLRNDYPRTLHDSIDFDGKTFLHYAAESNNVSMTRHLINNNHDLNIQDNHGNSPLMLAVQNHSFVTAKLLVKAGANIYSCSGEASRVLLHKARSNSEYPVSNECHVFIKTVLQKLRKNCCDDEKLMLSRLRELGCSLVQVISLGDANVTRLMLENGYLVDEQELPEEETALHRAVYLDGDVKNVEVLLEFGASVDAPNKNEFPALFYLFDKPSDFKKDEEDRVEIMKILIKHGGLSSKAPYDATQYILECSGLLAISALTQCGIDINNYAALSYLVNNLNDDALEVLRGKSFAVNDHDGFSLISNAVCNGSLRKVQFLLEHGADPNSGDVKYGNLPLFNVFPCSLDSDSPESHLLAIVRLLLQYGADAQHVYTGGNQEQYTVFDMQSTSSFRQESLKSIVAHLALIEDRGKTISELIRVKIDSLDRYKEHFRVCKEQIEEIKGTTINGSVTLYKLLTESHMVITRYARNQDLTSKFEEAMKDKRFLDPYYSISLHKRVGKAIYEAKLKEEAIVVMNKIFPWHLRNCTDIFREILGYSTCDDLKNICRVRNLQDSEPFHLDNLFV